MKIKKINPSLQQDLLFINKLNCCKFNFLVGKAVSLLLIAFLPSSKPVKRKHHGQLVSTLVTLPMLIKAKGSSSLEVFQTWLDKSMADLI